MNYNILTYGIYLLITLVVVFGVGATLYKNGRPFLINTFSGNVTTADALNKVLLAGYYLVNAGYVIIALRIWKQVGTLREMTEVLAGKVGTIILILGIMHLFNVLCLLVAGKRKKHQPTNIH